jgi:cell division protein FtsQ
VRPPQSALPALEDVIELAGYGLQQVAVTGHRFTPDGDILDAVDLGRARTLLSFDPRAAQERIEALPWVERASVSRIFPDRLEITIKERTPFAVWSHNGRTVLIDKTGRILSPVAANAAPALPRVAGAGAPSQAAALFALLASHPSIANRLELAERVGERRWTLRLSGGLVVHLPADGEAAALARFTGFARSAPALTGEIDLRTPDRWRIREPAAQSEPAQRAAEMRSTAGRG